MPPQAGVARMRTPRAARSESGFTDRRLSKCGNALSSLAMTLFILFAAAARTGIVPADFVVVDRLLVAVSRRVTPYELQLGQFLILFALNIAREILDVGLR